MDLDKLAPLLASTALIVILTAVGLIVIQLLGRLFTKRLRGLESITEDRRQQLVTLVQIAKWALDVTLIITAVLMLLSRYGLNLTPLIAGVGVVGLALSLGAQTLIKDLIGGLLIVVENQYAVGDTIEVGDVTGLVERVTLRATHVRAADGSLVVVPNGEVRVVANASKGWSRAVVDIGVAYEADLEKALNTLRDVATSFAQEPQYEPLLLEVPSVMGPMSLGIGPSRSGSRS